MMDDEEEWLKDEDGVKLALEDIFELLVEEYGLDSIPPKFLNLLREI